MSFMNIPSAFAAEASHACLRIGVSLALVMPTLCHADEHYLCQADEQVIFGCHAGKKMISLCGTPDFTVSHGTVQYRYGVPGQIELEYPDPPAAAHGHFLASFTGYSGGGETRVRFVNHGVQYLLFDRTIRTAFGADGKHDPEFSAGVSIQIAGKAKNAAKLCSEPSGFVANTSDSGQFDQEAFDEDYDLGF